MNRPKRTFSSKKVTYSEEDWRRLEKFRGEAEKILKSLEKYNIEGIVHGSVARGDVGKKSDIDIMVPHFTSSFKVELALRNADYRNLKRKIVMATPWQLPKGHIMLDESKMVTIPLEKPKRLEKEFYEFGGAANIKQLKNEERVPGVDKRLILIEPLKDGHKESQVIGRENEVAKILGVSIEIVAERIEVLTKRDKVGKTGIFLQRELEDNENFESIWKKITETNPQVSKRSRG
ncbi:MAG: nucleotidyltransferase domain-containing protein [Candidatus Hadarchaeia archaeon]